MTTAALGGGAVLIAWFGPFAFSGYPLPPAVIAIIGLIDSVLTAAVALSLREDAPKSAAA